MAVDSNTNSAPYGYAGFWWRLLALIIDTGLLVIIGGILGGLLGLQMGLAGAANDSINAMGNLTSFVLNWLYFAVFESSEWRGTPGKRILGLRVTDEFGGRIGFGRATGRHFAKVLSALILCVGFMMAGWTRRKQALHDMVSGCLVVRQKADSRPLIVPT